MHPLSLYYVSDTIRKTELHLLPQSSRWYCPLAGPDVSPVLQVWKVRQRGRRAFPRS